MKSMTSVLNEMNLSDLTFELKRCFRRSAKDVVYIGYILRRVLDLKLWQESYDDFDSYLHSELHLEYSVACRFIQINKKFSCSGNSAELSDKYSDFSQGLLIEMLSMTPEQEAKVTPDMTVKQAREIKKKDKKPISVQPQKLPEKVETIIDGNFREIEESEKIATSQLELINPDDYFREYLDAFAKFYIHSEHDWFLKDFDNRVSNVTTSPSEILQHLGTGSRTWYFRIHDGVAHINLFDEYVQIFDEKQNFLGNFKWFHFASSILNMWNVVALEAVKKDNSHLPVLKNNDQRKDWLSRYKDWGLWYHDDHIDVNYYKFDFEDGSRLVAAEYPHRRNHWNNDYSDQVYFHLLEKNYKGYKSTYDKQYVHAPDSETYIVDFLKDLQKKK